MIYIEIESTKEDVLNVFRKTAKEGNLATNYENPILTKTGKQKIIKWNNTSFTTTEGQIIITSIGEDITERKKIEMELLQNKILLESSIESPQDMIILSLDHEYKYLYYNEVHKISMMTAYNTKPTIGHCIFDFITNKTDIKRLKTHYDEALSGDGHTFIDKYGEEPNCFYYEVRIYPIYNDKKEIIGITSFSQDITKRKQAEAELKAKHDSLMMSNDLFVGRELKMIELKKEINKLLEGKGEKPKYNIIR